MAYNKYEDHYSKLSFVELITRLRSHMRTGNGLSQDWYEALVEHLRNRPLSPQERDIFEKVLNGQDVQIGPPPSNNAASPPPTHSQQQPASPLKIILGVIGIILLLIKLFLAMSR